MSDPLAGWVRKVAAYPEPRIVHDGDCRFWGLKVCTCGLLHTLRWHDPQGERYPARFDEDGEENWALSVIESCERRPHLDPRMRTT